MQSLHTATGSHVTTATGSHVTTATGSLVTTATDSHVTTATGSHVITATDSHVTTATGSHVAIATGSHVIKVAKPVSGVHRYITPHFHRLYSPTLHHYPSENCNKPSTNFNRSLLPILHIRDQKQTAIYFRILTSLRKSLLPIISHQHI